MIFQLHGGLLRAVIGWRSGHAQAAHILACAVGRSAQRAYRQRMQTRTLTPSALESSAADDEAAAEGAVRGRALGGGEASCSMGRSDQIVCVRVGALLIRQTD